MANNNQGQNGGIEIPEARTALNTFLAEIAEEFGIPDYFDRDKGDFPARIHGYIGGNSVRAFSYFAQNFLRSLPLEVGAELLQKYGLHIPEEEKIRVKKYLDKIGYQPGEVSDDVVVNTVQPIDPALVAKFIPGGSFSGQQYQDAKDGIGTVPTDLTMPNLVDQPPIQH